MSKNTKDDRGWRIANAVLWYLALFTGYFSREVYDGIRDFARVNTLRACVNNPWFLPVTLSFVVGRFVHGKGLSKGLNASISMYEGIGFGLVSLVAFSALPLQLLLEGIPPAERILYFWYALKLGTLVYLLRFFTRYFILGDDDAFFSSHRPQDTS